MTFPQCDVFGFSLRSRRLDNFSKLCAKDAAFRNSSSVHSFQLLPKRLFVKLSNPNIWPTSCSNVSCSRSKFEISSNPESRDARSPVLSSSAFEMILDCVSEEDGARGFIGDRTLEESVESIS